MRTNLLSPSRSWIVALAAVVPFLTGTRECEGGGGEDCVCPAVYAPVCGVDGATYGNDCEAACADVEVAYEGECRVEPVTCWDDGECAPGEHCNRDLCWSPPCEDGEACLAVCYGICEPGDPPHPCLSSEECAAGEYCAIDPDCPVCREGEACPAIACGGTCEPLPTDPICYGDADCEAGEICAWDAGPPCWEAEDGSRRCPPYEPADHGICVPGHEPPHECYGDWDCPPDHACVIERPVAYDCVDDEDCTRPLPGGFCVPREPELCLSDDACEAWEYCDHSECRGGDGDPAIDVCYGACEPRICPLIECAPREEECPYGLAVDASGCPSCECAEEPPPPPECGDVFCALACERGFESDERGCPICECAE
jgi:hypothetical protein